MEADIADRAPPAEPPGLATPPGLSGRRDGGSQPESIPGTPLSAVTEVGGGTPQGSPPRLAGAASQTLPSSGRAEPASLCDLTGAEGLPLPPQKEDRTDSPRVHHSGSDALVPGERAASRNPEDCPTPQSPGDAAPAAEGNLGLDGPEAPSAPASPREDTLAREAHAPEREATPENGLDCDPTWESVRQDVYRLCQLAAEPYLLYMGFQEGPPHQGLVLPAAMAFRWGVAAVALGSLASVLGVWAAGMGTPKEEGGNEGAPLEPSDPSTCPPVWERGLPVYPRPSYTEEIYEVDASGYWDHILVAMAVGLVAGLAVHWLYATRPRMQYGPIHWSDRPPPNPISDGADPTGGSGPRTGWERKPEHHWGPPPGSQRPIQEWIMGPQGGPHAFHHPSRGLDPQGPPALYPGLPSG